MDAKKIRMEILSDDDQAAIDRSRKQFDYILEPARKLAETVPSDIRNEMIDAVENAIMGGEANGFCAGFYYALQMMEGLRSGATSAAPFPVEACRQQYDDELAQQGVPQNLRALLVANNVGLDELQAVVSKQGYFPADMPVCDYPQAFVDNCLVAAWPQVHNIILNNRK